VKTGGRLVKHARYYWLSLAESHLTRRLFGMTLRRISALPCPQTEAWRAPQSYPTKEGRRSGVPEKASERRFQSVGHEHELAGQSPELQDEATKMNLP